MWCDHKKGCDDAGDFSSSMYPYQGCQLMQLPKDVEPQNWDRGPMFSSFQSGYITGEHAALMAPWRTGMRASSCQSRAGLMRLHARTRLQDALMTSCLCIAP